MHQGTLPATEDIWFSYRDRLRGFLRARVRQEADVEDILQEVLLKTHLNLAKFEGANKLKAWLYKVTRCAIADYYRRPRIELESEEIEYLKTEAPLNQLASETVLQELSKCVGPFLKCIPEKYRVVVEAVDLHGKSQKALAAELGLSYTALKSRVQRGRKMLRASLEACCNFTYDARGNLICFEPKPCTPCE